MKHFVFLYPVPERINFEIERGGYEYLANKKSLNSFRKKYKTLLNQCLDIRYRKKGFVINYITYRNHPISEIIDIHPSDKIIEAGEFFKKNISKQKEISRAGNPDFILDQLKPISMIRIGGFYMFDCVDKFAQRAYERGIDALVDEDLTEFFCNRIKRSNFKVDKYPNFNLQTLGKTALEMFLKTRRQRPWLINPKI